jgi:hypothetical protein
MVKPGMTLSERLSVRDGLTEWYAEHGHDEEVAMRAYQAAGCQRQERALHDCSAEVPGGPGCLCACHDAAAP